MQMWKTIWEVLQNTTLNLWEFPQEFLVQSDTKFCIGCKSEGEMNRWKIFKWIYKTIVLGPSACESLHKSFSSKPTSFVLEVKWIDGKSRFKQTYKTTQPVRINHQMTPCEEENRHDLLEKEKKMFLLHSYKLQQQTL